MKMMNDNTNELTLTELRIVTGGEQVIEGGAIGIWHDMPYPLPPLPDGYFFFPVPRPAGYGN